jgi:ergothioneine biosynthesis protein EgtB
MPDLSSRYLDIRSYSEQLCSPLTLEDYVPQPDFFTSPPKWHLAHTTWFFEEMVLKKYLAGYKNFHDDFSYLFNSYYNTVGERTLRNHRGVITRPGVEEVYKYRAYVDQHMKKLLMSDFSDEVKVLVTLGLNHEQQHQELLLTDLKYTLSLNPLYPVYKKGFDLTATRSESNGFVKIDEGVYEIGFQGDGFCFDNELGRHKVYLNEYEISEKLVTNGEYAEFIAEGGYQNFRFWLDEGWAWVNENRKKAPLYWVKKDGEWFVYTFSGLKPLDLEEELCHISYYEATAFAAWKKMRLPTEFEWEVASARLNWGSRWEWTGSAYLPYPDFEIAEGAVGEYNGKFMINQMVLRGASTATSPGHSRNTYRNFFHPQFEWQFTGIRLVRL